MGKSTITTKSGLENSSNKLLFEINTSNVEVFLKKKFQILNEALEKTKKDTNRVDPNKIQVRGVKLGRNFCPLLLILPEQAINRAQYDPNISSIFRNDDEDAAVPVKKWYYEAIAKWLFPKDDVNGIRSHMIQKQLEIVRQDDVKNFIYYSKPRRKTVVTADGREVSNLYVWLNPYTLFHDMLIDTGNPNSRFTTKIVDFTVLEDNVTKFSVEREVIRRKKDKSKQGFDALLSRIASS